MMSYESRNGHQKVLELVDRVEKETIRIDGNESTEWAIKSVTIIAKVLKKHQKFEAFFSIIMNGSSKRCCHMENERLQGDRARMNLFILRLFRFPWLRYYTQIKSNERCLHRYDRRGTMACMNPWHYDYIKVPMPNLPAVVINRQTDFGDYPREEGEVDDIANGPNVAVRGDDLNRLFKMIESTTEPSMDTCELQSPAVNGRVRENEEEDQSYDVQSLDLSPDHSPLNSDVDMSENSEEQTNQNALVSNNREMQMRQPNRFNDETEEPCEEDVIEGYDTAVGKWEKALEQRNLSDNHNYDFVEYTENGEFWATISYYEESDIIGNIMKVSRPNFLIDGYASSPYSTDRMSLGYFTNVNRTKLTADLRKLIGHGVRVYYLGGDVFVESLCEQPIFIQSYNTNLRCSFQINAVVKLAPYGTMNVFSMKQFAAQLSEAADKTYQDVFALNRTCGFRVSFCKGWGEYYKITKVIRAPCWLQVSLPGPKKWLDNVLECMGVPVIVCGSRS